MSKSSSKSASSKSPATCTAGCCRAPYPRHVLDLHCRTLAAEHITEAIETIAAATAAVAFDEGALERTLLPELRAAVAAVIARHAGAKAAEPS